MIDPDMKTVLDGLADVKPMEMMSIDEIRSFIGPAPIESRRPVGSVEDRMTDGGVPFRVYGPMSPVSGGLLVYFHGGGFVSGSVESHDNVARDLCEALGRVTVSVEYRLAPENPFPAAADDCLSSVLWMIANSEELGYDRRHGVLLSGDSAGANLATVTCMRMPKSVLGNITGQILVYPVTAYHTPPTDSYLRYGDGYMLTRGAMKLFWDNYIESPDDIAHPYAAPLRADDLSGLPPALVLTAEYDPLRDEGEAYAAALARAGVDVTVKRYPGLIHGFMRMAGNSARAAESLGDIRAWVVDREDIRG